MTQDTAHVTCRVDNEVSRILVLKDENPYRWLSGSKFLTDRRKPINQRHGVTSRKGGIIDYMSVKPQKLQMPLSF
jgi:hypothetical protein